VRRFRVESTVRLLDGSRLTPTNAIQAGEMRYHEGGSSPYHRHVGTPAHPAGPSHCYLTFKGRGVVKVGETVEIIGVRDTRNTVVTGVEMFKKLLDQGQAGDNVGTLLRGIERTDVERGMVLAKPGSIKPHTNFSAQVYVLTKDEGGRHTPFFNGYRPQFYLRTTDVTGEIQLPEGVEMVMPGDNIEMQVKLITPIAIEQGSRFAIREGGRTVGAGAVASVQE